MEYTEEQLEDILDNIVKEAENPFKDCYNIGEVIRKYTGNQAVLKPEFQKEILPAFEKLMQKYDYGVPTGKFGCETYNVTEEFKKAKRAGGHYSYIHDEIWEMNKLLTQLNTKDEGECHSMEELCKATGFDEIAIEVIGKRIQSKGDCDYHHHCISISRKGKHTVRKGYKKEDGFAPSFHYEDKSTKIVGDGILFAPNNLGEIKDVKIQKGVEDKETKELNKKSFRWTKKQTRWTIIGVALLLFLWIIDKIIIAVS